MERKRTVNYGELGKNRANVVEEDLNPNESSQYTASLLREAGQVLAPMGTRYLGSAVVHFFSKQLIETNPTFMVLTQTQGMDRVNEHHADLGWKQLGSKMQEIYGRTPPKTR